MSEPKEITYDVCGDTITQSIADYVTGMIAAARSEGATLVNITLRNVSTINAHRLIVDYGDVIGLLVDELREKQATKAAIVEHGRGRL